MSIRSNDRNLSIVILMMTRTSSTFVTNVIFVVSKDLAFVKDDAIPTTIEDIDAIELDDFVIANDALVVLDEFFIVEDEIFVVANNTFVVIAMTSLRSIERSFFYIRFS